MIIGVVDNNTEIQSNTVEFEIVEEPAGAFIEFADYRDNLSDGYAVFEATDTPSTEVQFSEFEFTGEDYLTFDISEVAVGLSGTDFTFDVTANSEESEYTHTLSISCSADLTGFDPDAFIVQVQVMYHANAEDRMGTQI